MADPDQLRELGEQLQAARRPRPTTSPSFLRKAAECLHGIEQSPGSSVMEAIQPSLKTVIIDHQRMKVSKFSWQHASMKLQE
ncbi:hypothetical protein ACP4OV_026747 [Aristida adscensionis]